MKALLFDTETTDLISNTLRDLKHQPRVIEFFGHIVDDSGKVHAKLEFLCDPGIPLPPQITEITKLTDKDLKGKPAFSHYLPEIRALMSKAEAVVAHNLAYDFRVLNFEFARAGKEAKWPVRRICTVAETEYMKGFRLNLTALHEELFGEPFANAHRARDDVAALTRCWLELRKREIV